MEIMTVDEVAAMLRISKGQVYEMSRERTRTGEVRSNPIPSLRIGGSVRFRRSDVEAWIEKLARK
jgi:excisionase family DNA binding protein